MNQHQKKDKLPGASLLRASQDRIQEWWGRGYLGAGNRVLPDRFITEAGATLPMLAGEPGGLDDVFEAVGMQQMRLRADQGVALWDSVV